MITTLGVDGQEKDLGMGLFAGINYHAGAKIVYFRGNVVSQAEFDAQLNHRYGVGMGNYFVLDCQEHVAFDICKASRANSCRDCYERGNAEKLLYYNCALRINVTMKHAYLQAIRRIDVGEELYYDYGDKYNLSP